MVKGYFDIIYIAINESEAYTPLVVDRYCMLSASVVLQRVKAVTRWCFKIVNARCQVNIFESAYSSSEKIRLKYSRFPRFKKILCVFIRKGFNHVCIVTSHVTIVKLNFASRIHCDWRGISRQYSYVIPKPFHLRHPRVLPPLSSPSPSTSVIPEFFRPFHPRVLLSGIWFYIISAHCRFNLQDFSSRKGEQQRP